MDQSNENSDQNKLIQNLANNVIINDEYAENEQYDNSSIINDDSNVNIDDKKDNNDENYPIDYNLQRLNFALLTDMQKLTLILFLDIQIKFVLDEETEFSINLIDLLKNLYENLTKNRIEIIEVRLMGSLVPLILSPSFNKNNEIRVWSSRMIELLTFKDINIKFYLNKYFYNDNIELHGLIQSKIINTIISMIYNEKLKNRLKSSPIEYLVEKLFKNNIEFGYFGKFKLNFRLNNIPKTVQLLFYPRIVREYEFSIDSFQIILNEKNFFQNSVIDYQTLKNQKIYCQCLFGEFEQTIKHFNNMLIITKHAHNLFGGGLMKYMRLLMIKFKPKFFVYSKALYCEATLVKAFFSEYKYVIRQRTCIETYFQSHFDQNDRVLKYLFYSLYIVILKRVENHVETIEYLVSNIQYFENIVTAQYIEILKSYTINPFSHKSFSCYCHETSMFPCFHDPIHQLLDEVFLYFVTFVYSNSSREASSNDFFLRRFQQKIYPENTKLLLTLLPTNIFDKIHQKVRRFRSTLLNHYIITYNDFLELNPDYKFQIDENYKELPPTLTTIKIDHENIVSLIKRLHVRAPPNYKVCIINEKPIRIPYRIDSTIIERSKILESFLRVNKATFDPRTNRIIHPIRNVDKNDERPQTSTVSNVQPIVHNPNTVSQPRPIEHQRNIQVQNQPIICPSNIVAQPQPIMYPNFVAQPQPIMHTSQMGVQPQPGTMQRVDTLLMQYYPGQPMVPISVSSQIYQSQPMPQLPFYNMNQIRPNQYY